MTRRLGTPASAGTARHRRAAGRPRSPGWRGCASIPAGAATNRPRPCGPLCRLKPAFQASGASRAVGQPRTTAPSQQLVRRARRCGIRLHDAPDRSADLRRPTSVRNLLSHRVCKRFQTLDIRFGITHGLHRHSGALGEATENSSFASDGGLPAGSAGIPVPGHGPVAAWLLAPRAWLRARGVATWRERQRNSGPASVGQRVSATYSG